MGRKDAITKTYMQDAATFADAFNFLLYNGRQVIKPERLHELDVTSVIGLPYGSRGKTEIMQKYRDLLKMMTAMTDGERAYLVLGIENQSEIHYVMPVRNMLYDALQYTRQIANAKKLHDENGDVKTDSKNFLSGFQKEDKLIPVVTLVIYWGSEKWEAPRTLYDMFEIDDKRLLSYVPNYKINLIEPYAINDKDFKKFRTDLRNAFKYIKYSYNDEVLDKLIDEEKSFKSLSRRTANLLNTVTGLNARLKTGEENINMCEAVRMMREKAIKQGKAENQAELEKAKAEVKQAKAEVKKANADVEKANAEVKKANADVEKANAEVKKAKAEIILAIKRMHERGISFEVIAECFGVSIKFAEDAVNTGMA